MAVLWAAFRARDLHPRFGLFPTQGDNNLKKKQHATYYWMLVPNFRANYLFNPQHVLNLIEHIKECQ